MDKRIPLKDFRERLKLMGTPVVFNEYRRGEEQIETEIAEMNQEKREKKLLVYQLLKNKEDVNQYLLSKYTDGNFVQAVVNGYDNSEQRLNNSIKYEYHVFFNTKVDREGEDIYNDYRPQMEFIKTKEIFNQFGDSFIYHFPIRQKLIDSKPTYLTDDDEEIVAVKLTSNSKNGIVYALERLRKNQDDNTNIFSESSILALRKYGFLNKNNKLRLEIPNLAVEKYIRSYTPERKKDVMDYLNNYFKIENQKEYRASVEDIKEEEISISSSEVKNRMEQLKKSLEDKKNSFKIIEFPFEGSLEEKVKLEEEIKKEYDTILNKLDAYNLDASRQMIEDFFKKFDKEIKKYETSYHEKILKFHNEKIKDFEKKYKKIKVNFMIPESEYDSYLKKEMDLIDEDEAEKERQRLEREKKEAEDKAKLDIEKAKYDAVQEEFKSIKALLEELYNEVEKSPKKTNANGANANHDIVVKQLKMIKDQNSVDDMNKKMNQKSYQDKFEVKKGALEKIGSGFPPELLDALDVLSKEKDIRKLLDTKFNKSKDKKEKEEEKEEKKEDKKEKEEEKSEDN